jgi:transposase-like protein
MTLGRPCTVCQHPDRGLIDAELVDGLLSAGDIARRFGLTHDSVNRHRLAHLPERLVKAAEVAETADARSLLDRLLDLSRETSDILREARTSGDHEVALKAIARAEKQLELQARLLHALEPRPHMLIQQVFAQINTSLTPEQQAAVLARLSPETRGLLGC